MDALTILGPLVMLEGRVRYSRATTGQTKVSTLLSTLAATSRYIVQNRRLPFTRLTEWEQVGIWEGS